MKITKKKQEKTKENTMNGKKEGNSTARHITNDDSEAQHREPQQPPEHSAEMRPSSQHWEQTRIGFEGPY